MFKLRLSKVSFCELFDSVCFVMYACYCMSDVPTKSKMAVKSEMKLFRVSLSLWELLKTVCFGVYACHYKSDAPTKSNKTESKIAK